MSLIFFLVYLALAFGNPAAELDTLDESGTAEPHTSREAGQHASSTLAYGVERVVDGDTIRVSVEGKIETVRLIGIDAPETADCYGNEAVQSLREELLGHPVQLAADPTQDDRDVYGRMLRYVWHHGTLVNAHILELGNAREYEFIYPYQYQDEFLAAEGRAREQGIGLWAACGQQ